MGIIFSCAARAISHPDLRMEEWTLELATPALSMFSDYVWANYLSHPQKTELNLMGIHDCAFTSIFFDDLLNNLN
jgi:hypothetical protein